MRCCNDSLFRLVNKLLAYFRFNVEIGRVCQELLEVIGPLELCFIVRVWDLPCDA